MSDDQAAGRPERHTQLMMDFERSGVWEVPAALQLRGTRSNFVLDLTEATFAAPEVVIDLALYNGSATIVVGPDVDLVSASAKWEAPHALDVADDDAAPQLVIVSGYARLGATVTLTRAG